MLRDPAEAVFDLDCAGHYLRRIKAVGFSIPCVGPLYTSVNCTATLLRSSIRMEPRPFKGNDPASETSPGPCR